jgi:O-antigen ligase
MSEIAAQLPWWKPIRSQSSSAADVVPQSDAGSSIAFMALVAFTAILLLSPQAWVPALKVIRVAFLAAGVAVAAHMVERTIHRQPITPLSPEIGIALALVCWSVMTIPVSLWPGGSVRLLTDNYLKAIAFFWMLGTIATSTSRIRALAWTLVLCSIPLSVTGIYNYINGERLATGVDGFSRIAGYTGASGLAGNPNDLALMLNLIIPLAGVLMVMARGMRRLLAAAALLIAVAAVVLTFSRAGFLTLSASFLMFLATLVRRKAPGAAIGILLIAVCVPPLLPDGYLDRLSTITNIAEDKTGSAQGRWLDDKIAVGVIADHPVIGVGIGQDVLAMNDARALDTWRRVHNAYLQYGVDLGIPGMFLFTWLNVLCFRTARAVDRRASQRPEHRQLALLAAGVQISLAAFVVGAMFHPIAYQFYFFTIGGLAIALRNACRAEVLAA